MAGLDADVVVIGAGITGAATARVLAQDGRAVIAVEQFRPGHDRGSSHGTSRIFRLSYPDERYVRLAQSALAAWREIEADHGFELIVGTGSLDLGDHVDAIASSLRACGVRFERLDGTEVSRRWPMRVEAGTAALHQPDAGVLLADKALQALLDGAVAAGAELRQEARATAIAPGPHTVAVTTTRGAITARAAVVAAGSWSAGLLTTAGIELPVVPTRETLAHFRMTDPYRVPCVIDGALRPPDGAHRAGSIPYSVPSPGVGLKAGLHHAGPVTDPDEPGAPDRTVVDWTVEWISRRFPDADPEPTAVETCLYTNTADESFVLQRHGRVIVASACSGHGFKFAPVVGRTAAALAAEARR